MSTHKVSNCYTHLPPDMNMDGSIDLETALDEMRAIADTDQDREFLAYLMDAENRLEILQTLEKLA